MPARLELAVRPLGLRQGVDGVHDRVHPACGDPRAVAAVNASRKIESVKSRHPHRWVMAADTVVAVRRLREPSYDILGQPQDRVDARRMLESLSGTTHLVCTAMAATGA